MAAVWIDVPVLPIVGDMVDLDELGLNGTAKVTNRTLRKDKEGLYFEIFTR